MKTPFELTTLDYEQRKCRFVSWHQHKRTKAFPAEDKESEKKQMSWEGLLAVALSTHSLKDFVAKLSMILEKKQVDCYSAVVLILVWGIEGRAATISRLKAQRRVVDLQDYFTPSNSPSGAINIKDWIKIRNTMRINHVSDVLMYSAREYDYALVDPKSIFTMAFFGNIDYFADSFSTYMETYRAMQAYLLSIFESNPTSKQVALSLSDVCRLGRLSPRSALQLAHTFVCGGATAAVSLLSIGVYVDCCSELPGALRVHYNNKILSQADRKLVLQHVLVFLRVEERYLCGQVCRDARQRIHCVDLEERAMRETLQIGLFGMDPEGWECIFRRPFNSWPSQYDSGVTVSFRLTRVKAICESIRTWHHMGARVFKRFQSALHRPLYLGSDICAIPCVDLEIKSIQLSQVLGEMTQFQYHMIVTDDLFSDPHTLEESQYTLAPEWNGIEYARQGWLCYLESGNASHGDPSRLVPFMIRGLLSDKVWFEKFVTPFNEWTPPLLYRWAEAVHFWSEAASSWNDILISAGLPKLRGLVLTPRVFELSLESVRVSSADTDRDAEIEGLSDAKTLASLVDASLHRWGLELDEQIGKIIRRNGFRPWRDHNTNWVGVCNFEGGKQVLGAGGIGYSVTGDFLNDRD